MAFKVFFALLAVASVANASIFMQCDDDKEPIKINIDNCNDEVCEVRKSEPAKMEFTFKPENEATELSASVSAQVAGKWMPWPLGAQSKVCNHLTKGVCPVPSNDEATYGLTVKIPFIAPLGTRTVVQVRVTDQNKDVIACTRIPVVVAA